MQRVDQQKIRMRGECFSQLPQILEITYSPRRLRAHRIKLRHHAANRVLDKLIGRGEARRGDNQRAGMLADAL